MLLRIIPRVPSLPAIFLLLGCGLNLGTGPEPVGEDACEILFIGNSLTYFNDQPEIVRRMAGAAGKPNFVGQATAPGVALDYHAQNADTRRKIQSRSWAYVILQQANWEVAFPQYHPQITGPLESLRETILANNPDTQILYSMDYSAKNGLTWFGQYRDFAEAQAMLREGTVVLSEAMGFSVAPVGWAFNSVVRDRPDIELFSPDRLHPSYLGSYLGAAVYFSTIFRESVAGNSFHGLASDAAASYLQGIGSRTVLDSLDSWGLSEAKNPCGAGPGS